jgi:hypothetical protein
LGPTPTAAVYLVDTEADTAIECPRVPISTREIQPKWST